ncbi:hypothetical protein, partial [uncultured Oscillibacter sp.]|uniref:hypothetical protein n=1 Tax=uncultured Oscillibacter sp. TaxID=876091 RepID=UPI0026229D2D
DDVLHQVGDTEVGVVVREAVHRAVELFQRESLQKVKFGKTTQVINYYTRFPVKSHVYFLNVDKKWFFLKNPEKGP